MFYVSVGHHDYGSSVKQNFKGLSFNTFTTRSFEAKEPRTPAVLKMVIFHKAWRTLMFIRTWYTWQTSKLTINYINRKGNITYFVSTLRIYLKICISKYSSFHLVLKMVRKKLVHKLFRFVFSAFFIILFIKSGSHFDFKACAFMCIK